MNEERDLEITKKVMSDTVPFQATMTMAHAWMVVSGLQFATRHPNMTEGPMNKAIRKVAFQFIKAIVQRHPEAREILEAGWSPEHDR